MELTKQTGLEFLLKKDLESLDYYRPAGVSLEEVLEECISIATGEQLDKIATDFGVYRSSETYPENGKIRFRVEDDASLRKKLAKHINNTGKEKVGCNHLWVPYQGIFESFEFCKHCDEKKKV